MDFKYGIVAVVMAFAVMGVSASSSLGGFSGASGFTGFNVQDYSVKLSEIYKGMFCIKYPGHWCFGHPVSVKVAPIEDTVTVTTTSTTTSTSSTSTTLWCRPVATARGCILSSTSARCCGH